VTTEVFTYRLADGVTPEQFWAADEHAQTSWYYQQPGIARRDTLTDEHGNWITIVSWSSAGSVPSTTPMHEAPLSDLIVGLEVRHYAGRPATAEAP
jgi:hypothetical protein